MTIDELSDKTDVEFLLVSTLMSTPAFTLIENEDFTTESSVKKLVVLSFRRYLVVFESNNRCAIHVNMCLFFICIDVSRCVCASKIRILVRSSSRDMTSGNILPGTFYGWPSL